MIVNDSSISIENINLKYSELDHNLALKPYSLLNFLQDIASENAEKFGFGYSFVSSRNYAWFLIKYTMHFENYPTNIQNLILKTQPRGYNKLFAYRDFELYDNDILLGRISSVWTMVDLETRNPVLISNVISDNCYMQPFTKREDDLTFARLKSIQDFQFTKDFEVRYNDIDVNGHANNGNYIIWAFEPLSLDFKTTHKIKTLDMMFKKEIKYGEKIVVEVSFLDDKTTAHTIKNMCGDEICLVQCTWI
ncbi:MAG: hypothetical protein E7Z90_05025 [Cyanobacteria bacterium SIG29]|nr:hypothetical protein [Cyanobacteria bacterium SIG29]